MRERAWAVVLLLLAASLPGCGAPAPGPTRNLVLISIDTLVAGRMSAYGHSRATTPAIDALLPDSLRFNEAFTTSPWTLPAHTSMLTGRYPSAIAENPNSMGIYRIPRVLPELFKQQGYRTAAFTAKGYVGADFGFARGFDLYDEKRGDSSARASAWLEESADSPFFLFFHTYAPHAPYKDRRFLRPGEGGRLKLLPFRTESVANYAHSRALTAKLMNAEIELTPDEQGFLLDFYDGEVAAADEMVAELIGTLERLGRLDDATLIVVSDHGEEFWQHTGRSMHHGHTLYDELLRIPLVWFERGLPSGGGVSHVPVTLTDLVPTLASRFGLERPEDLDGVDLSPLLDGDEAERPERPLFAEAVLHGPDRFSVRTARGKLILTPRPREQKRAGVDHPVPVKSAVELYLPDDPNEQNEVSEQHPGLRDELIAILREHQKKARARSRTAPEREVSQETLDQLRELGYLE